MVKYWSYVNGDKTTRKFTNQDIADYIEIVPLNASADFEPYRFEITTKGELPREAVNLMQAMNLAQSRGYFMAQRDIRNVLGL